MALDPRQKDLWLREFRLNGFVVLRNFLPIELVRDMHDQLLPLVRGEYERALKGEAQTLRGPGRLSVDVGRFADLLGGPLADERYRHNPIVLELVESILGPPSTWGRGWTRVECVFKGSAYMGFHSDQVPDETPDPHAANRTVRVTYNIPLVDFTWANGATEFIPGSHSQPRAFLTSGIEEIANLYPVRPVLRCGDALVRDGNTFHRGTPNLTDEPRAMLDQTYRTAKAGK